MFERLRGVDTLAVHIRPVCRSEILDREPPVGAARNACVMAGDLGIAPELSLVLRSVATDQQVDVDAQDLALFLPLGHPYLVADHRPRSLTAIMTGVPANTPAIGESSSDAQAVTEAERSGRPFLVFRDANGRQQLFFFDPGAASATVGRGSSADLALAWDDRVSRLHARFERERQEDWVLVDDGLSSNGTYVNERARQRQTPHDRRGRCAIRAHRSDLSLPGSANSARPGTTRAVAEHPSPRRDAVAGRGEPVDDPAPRTGGAVPSVQGPRHVRQPGRRRADRRGGRSCPSAKSGATSGCCTRSSGSRVRPDPRRESAWLSGHSPPGLISERDL